MDKHFGYQRLQVFQVAKGALALVVKERARFRGMPGELGSQLDRAMLSVVNNIVEGAGRWSPADQRRHYQIARGSANEAAGCIEIAELYGLPAELVAELHGELHRVVQMLTVMCRASGR